MQSDSQRRATAKWQAENMTNVAARVRREVAEEFKAAAKEDGATPNELLRGWIGEYINREVSDMTTLTNASRSSSKAFGASRILKR